MDIDNFLGEKKYFAPKQLFTSNMQDIASYKEVNQKNLIPILLFKNAKNI